MRTQQKFPAAKTQFPTVESPQGISHNTSNPVHQFWQGLCNIAPWLLIDPNQSLIIEKRDRQGKHSWRVYDLATGHHIICNSEQEVCAWIEQCWLRNRP